MARKSAPPNAAVTTGRGFLAALGQRLYRPWTLAVVAVVVAGAICLPRLRRYLPDLAARDEYQLPSSEIAVTSPPQWVPRNFVEQVVAGADLPATLSLLDN